MQPHNSQSSRENATPSSGTYPLAYHLEVPHPPPLGGKGTLKSFTYKQKLVQYLYLYLFICHTITIMAKRCQKKCRKKWQGGLKETIELMLIRPSQLQFFEDGITITATDTK